ncbi:MAG TPA: VOC family protein, partial [Stellaceae bacterium]|nr:VOC family protein [Stellaceae bacterium]
MIRHPPIIAPIAAQRQALPTERLLYIDHVGINTNDMEATLQFYCGILGMRLVRTTRTPDGRRHYNVEIGG